MLHAKNDAHEDRSDPADRRPPEGTTGAVGKRPEMWPFSYWLLNHWERPDAVGRVAREASVDPDWPYEAATLGEILAYLDAGGGPLALTDAARVAWAEYAAARRAAGVEEQPGRDEPGYRRPGGMFGGPEGFR